MIKTLAYETFPLTKGRGFSSHLSLTPFVGPLLHGKLFDCLHNYLGIVLKAIVCLGVCVCVCVCVNECQVGFVCFWGSFIDNVSEGHWKNNLSTVLQHGFSVAVAILFSVLSRKHPK